MPRRPNKPIRSGEILATLGLSGVALFLLYHFDGFDRFVAFAETHESWELDEWVSFIVVAAASSVFILIRRTRELAAEVKRRIAAEEREGHLARYDQLTGLANRRLLSERLHNFLKTEDAPVGVMLFDLDRFKPVNDIYGHTKGDAVLRAVAERLAIALPDAELIARIGGDEFVCLCRFAQHEEELLQRAVKALRTVAAPIRVGSLELDVGASVGISTYPAGGRSAEKLLTSADLAMYEAKRAGRGRAVLFQEYMRDNLRERAEFEQDFRAAVSSGEGLEPYFQPIVRLSDESIVGFEALARWNNIKFGPVSPEVFIGIAEDLDLIDELFNRLLRQACRTANNWPNQIDLSFNLSPRQLRNKSLSSQIATILEETGFDPHRLVLEVTESAIVDDIPGARETFERLHALGTKIALDDFGKGYSSLSHLHELNFDRLKIDGSFIFGMDAGTEGLQIVEAITSLGSALDMPVTAEGVETMKQVLLLRAMSCRYAQGFYFGRPQDAEATRQLVQEAFPEWDAVASLGINALQPKHGNPGRSKAAL